MHDLVVVGAHSHARVDRDRARRDSRRSWCTAAPCPVLVARERPLASGVVAATRALPADRFALTAGTHIAARLGAELTVVHVPERDDDKRRAELHAELANARALLGREIDYYQDARARPRERSSTRPRATAPASSSSAATAGSGLSALASVSERVAHLAPCSVLVMRGT